MSRTKQQYLANVVNHFHNMRKDPTTTEIVVHCNGSEFRAHKKILMAGSPYFRAMFTSGMKEDNSGIVKFDTMKPEVCSVVLDFLYTGEIVDCLNDVDMLQEVFAAAHLLEVEEMMRSCRKLLLANLSLANYDAVWNLAMLYSDEFLKIKVAAYLMRQLVEFKDSAKTLNTDKLVKLQLSQIEYLTKDLNYALGMHTTVYGILLWVRHDFQNREYHLEDLFGLLNIKELPAQMFTKDELVHLSITVLKRLSKRILLKCHNYTNTIPRFQHITQFPAYD